MPSTSDGEFVASPLFKAVDRMDLAVEDGMLTPDEPKRLRAIFNGEANDGGGHNTMRLERAASAAVAAKR
jgi:hypothetical protein